jgi:hypothetical protein
MCHKLLSRISSATGVSSVSGISSKTGMFADPEAFVSEAKKA